MDALSRSLADASSRRSLLKILGAGAAGTAVTAVGLNEARAASKDIGPLNNQLTGIPMKASKRGRKFSGKLDVIRFEERSGSIVAIAQLTGKVDKKQGNGKKRISQQLEVPVQVSRETAEVQAQVVCEILNLVLGPIDLNILGLRLQVNTIRIRLSANSQGGLLGSLLCGLLGPLNLGALGSIVNLLNQILGQLGGA
jgi:hypothetical protein